MFNINRFIITLVLVNVYTYSFAGFLLQTPPLATKEFIAQQEQKISQSSIGMGMNFGSFDSKTGNHHEIDFNYKLGKTALTVLINGHSVANSKEFDMLNKDDSFLARVNKLKYRVYRSILDKFFTGSVRRPLVIKNAQPKQLSVADTACLIKNAQAVIYTGAGISAGVVPTLPALLHKFGITDATDRQKNFYTMLYNLLNCPERLISIMDSFYKACLYGKPTAAHQAVKELAIIKNWGVLTENLDLLHQRSGILPLHRNFGSGDNWIKQHVPTEDLKKIDYIIIIGLASDESGFLAWYKSYNPKGVIVAINLQQPEYMSDTDIFIQGDAQIIVPKLLEEVKKLS